MSLDRESDLKYYLQGRIGIEDLYNRRIPGRQSLQVENEYVKRRNSSKEREERLENKSNMEKEQRRLENMAYRRSLESISEYKTSSSYSSLRQTRTHHSADSSSPDYTDYLNRYIPSTDVNTERIFTDSSSYFSWIDSLNSEYLDATPNEQFIDNKSGEWNNFWLNYNNARNKYMSSPVVTTQSANVSSPEEFSDARSSINTTKEQPENEIEHFYLTKAEITESLECCQKLTELLQNALNRTENDSQNTSRFVSSQNSVKKREYSWRQSF